MHTGYLPGFFCAPLPRAFVLFFALVPADSFRHARHCGLNRWLRWFMVTRCLRLHAADFRHFTLATARLCTLRAFSSLPAVLVHALVAPLHFSLCWRCASSPLVHSGRSAALFTWVPAAMVSTPSATTRCSMLGMAPHATPGASVQLLHASPVPLHHLPQTFYPCHCTCYTTFAYLPYLPLCLPASCTACLPHCHTFTTPLLPPSSLFCHHLPCTLPLPHTFHTSLCPLPGPPCHLPPATSSSVSCLYCHLLSLF